MTESIMIFFIYEYYTEHTYEFQVVAAILLFYSCSMHMPRYNMYVALNNILIWVLFNFYARTE